MSGENTIKLSILIPTVPRRKESLDRLLSVLYPQLKDEVELIVMLDNKKRTLGYKRREMMTLAQGEYVVFIDDDDDITNDYVSILLQATNSGADVINYWVEISINGSEKQRVYYSKDLTEHFDWTYYYRKPNHLMCFRREIANREQYNDLRFGEDSDYAERVYKYIQTEHNIDKILYHYRSIPNNSECK